MAEDTTSPAPGVSEDDLVAYLDGELDDETSRRIEGLLVSDPKVRKTLQQLERTWDLLDSLEMAQVDQRLAQSTLEVVTVAAAEDLRRQQSDVSRRRWRQWLLGAGGLLAAGLAGFFLVLLLRPDPDRQLLDDLPIVENLDQYRQIDDFEFLKMLRVEWLFCEDEDEEEESSGPGASQRAASTAIGRTRAQRRQWLEGLGPAQRAELAQARQRFETLDDAEKDRLRGLDRQIEGDPDGDALGEVMRRHYQWLKKLPLYRRAELLELPPAERISQVKQMHQEEDERRLRRPSQRDAEALLGWMNEYAASHEDEVLQSLPEDRREEEAKTDPEHRRRLVMSILWMRWHSGKRKGLPMPTESDLAEAHARLSPETRKRIQSKPPEDQWRLIASWARYLVHYQGDLRRGHGGLPEVSEAELIHFFEYELTPVQRDYLLGLSRDEMQRQLRRMYFRIKLPRP